MKLFDCRLVAEKQLIYLKVRPRLSKLKFSGGIAVDDSPYILTKWMLDHLQKQTVSMTGFPALLYSKCASSSSTSADQYLNALGYELSPFHLL